jgi:hypothetical protein
MSPFAKGFLAFCIIIIIVIVFLIYNNLSTDCVVGEWSECSNGKRTRVITPATNGGTCAEVDTSQNCTDCVVGEWTACSNNQRTRVITPATNGGTCAEVDTSQNCNDCVLGQWSECSNGKMTRTITPATNGGTACTEVDTSQNCFVTLYYEPNYTSTSHIFSVGIHTPDGLLLVTQNLIFLYKFI